MGGVLVLATSRTASGTLFWVSRSYRKPAGRNDIPKRKLIYTTKKRYFSDFFLLKHRTASLTLQWGSNL